MSRRHKEFKKNMKVRKRQKLTNGMCEGSHIRIVRIKNGRASGGCLGNKRRRRTWYSAKSLGELRTSCDPRESEWGNPALQASSITEYIGY